MKYCIPPNIMGRLLARFERGLLIAIGFFIMLLLIAALLPATSAKAHATGFNSWPHATGVAQCWSNLFEQYGTNMLRLSQYVDAGSALVKYHITLQVGEEKNLVCYPASGKVVETERKSSS